MRRLLSNALVFIAAAAHPVALAAQGSTGSDAGVFLLLPTGAQSVGMGQAVVASTAGSESIWWNPAGLAIQHKKEVAVHHSQTVVGRGDALAFVLPAKRAAFALSVNVLDLGEQPVTDELGQSLGKLLPRDLVFAGSAAVAVLPQLRFGLNYKVVQFRIDCTGDCGTVQTFSASSQAADAGVQYSISPGSPLALGLVIRNFGGKVKSSGADKGDDLPTRTEAGFIYHVAILDKYLKETEVRGAASLVTTRGTSGTGFRLGADVAYQSKLHLRGGYVGDRKRDESSASVGFGLESGHLVFDIARSFGGLSADAGTPPTYISLKYLF